ncbi:MAG: response regulator transcription factor [Deltaproteobacteria bacterium]|nr:response regulator transcription factor [Deltaproteobacteria bacterium]
MGQRVVLIADSQGDDWGLMTPLLGALSDVGAMTELFTDCTAGLLSAVRGGTDLVVIDMDTPSFGGLDSLVKIGRIASRVPVLLLSAEDSNARRMWAVEVGVVGYVTKPVDGQALARFVAKVLRGY